MKYIVAFIASISLLSSCVEPNTTYSKVPPGIWRGVLYLEKPSNISANKGDEVFIKTDYPGELPFNFEIIYDNEEQFHMEIINADERIVVDDITYGRDKATAKDTIVFDFPAYDTYLKAVYQEGVMEGRWHVNYKEGYSIQFRAEHGEDARFKQISDKQAEDFSGKWNVTFEPGEDAYKGVAILAQKDKKLEGTVLTETGDYRFLQGNVAGDKAYLSVFDGSHAFTFEFKKLQDETLTGQFRSGTHYLAPFEASKTDKIELADAYSMTKPTSDEPFAFSFPNSDGEFVSLEDEEYQGKMKVIKVMGTWCPNCMDATNYLTEYLNQNSRNDVAIIAIAFERYRDQAKALAQLKKYKEKKKLPFEIVYGGYYNKEEANKQLPQIDKVISYPTLILLDQNDMIRKIYTGFSGPATPQYESFKEEFEANIDAIRNEI